MLAALRNAARRKCTRHGQQIGVKAIDVVKHIGGRETKPARRWLLRQVHTSQEVVCAVWRAPCGVRRVVCDAPAHVGVHHLGVAL